MNEIKIGWAQADLTSGRPLLMSGQMYHRVSESVRDPITATALALDNGEAQAVFVSLDMTEPPVHIEDLLRQKLGGLDGLSFDSVSINVTHTHNSSDFFGDFLREDNELVFGADVLPEAPLPENALVGEEAREYLSGKVADVIARAWNGRAPGGISAAHDYAAVGFSRRAVFRRGEGSETIMYGDCSREDFLGFEPGGDNAADMLYTWDMTGRLTGVAIDVACPSQVFELHRFITADYWGFVRSDVRRALGEVFVLPLCGAAGDLSPLDLVRLAKSNREELKIWAAQAKEVVRNIDLARECARISERITAAVLRGYREAKTRIDHAPAFRHETLPLELPLRLVSRGDYEIARKRVEQIRQDFSPENRMETEDVVRAFAVQGVMLRWQLQQQSEVFPCVCHIVRIGKAAIATNPFELFSEYGLRMKARVQTEQLFVVQLANGIGGYLPSAAAVTGGGYSSKAASSFCGPAGGDMLVERTIEAVDRLFAGD